MRSGSPIVIHLKLCEDETAAVSSLIINSVGILFIRFIRENHFGRPFLIIQYGFLELLKAY